MNIFSQTTTKTTNVSSFGLSTTERDMVISRDYNFQHSIHKCLCGIKPITIVEKPLRRCTLHNGNFLMPFIYLCQNQADRLKRIIPQIMTSRPQSTKLNIAQIAHVKTRPCCTVDNEEPHRRFHSEVSADALKLRKSQLY